MPDRIGTITSEVSRRIQKLLGGSLRSIILFGSYARGDYDEGSDIDIMVLADIPDKERRAWRHELSLISSRVSLENDITVSIILCNKALFEERLPILPFYQNVMNDGVTIYAS